MSITPQLRQMMGQRAAIVFAEFARCFYIDPSWARIDAAKQRIDQSWSGYGWKPSELLTIGYCVLKTSRNPASAQEFLNQVLGGEGR